VSLQLENLVVARGGRPVVRDVSLDIPAGEVTALLGPNGAGKSSLVLAVGGVLPTVSGTVRLDDAVLSSRRPERIRGAGVAIVPEGRRLLPDLTVDENLQVATYALPRAEGRAGRDRALELFPELGKRLNATGRMLSGGEQQMVVLAQAIVSQPRFMLIDELSLGLAPVMVREIYAALPGIAAEGMTVAIVEQDVRLAQAMSRRVYCFQEGRVSLTGASEALTREQIAHAYFGV
jgi:branched-chain amino acid transport system ATP-binding protein